MPTERTVLVRLKGNVSDFQRALMSAAAGVAALRKEVNTTNERTAWMVQGILSIAPAAVTAGAAAIPVIAGLATQMTVAAGVAGVAALAFNGIGDALKALNNYQLDPTNEHLQKLHQTMAKIGPDGEHFVRFLDQVGDKWSALANIARGEMFSGMEDGIRTLTGDLLPRLKGLVRSIAGTMGELTAEGASGLAGPKFQAFFDYLRDEARPLLKDMARTMGNFIEGIANLLVAFGPLTDRFSNGLLEWSRSFADWSEGLDSNQGFQHFLDYINHAIPLALDFLSALVGAVAALTEAAAPVGDLMLPAFTAFLRIVEQLADTPLGPMFVAAAAAASLYGRAMALAENTTSGALGKITANTRTNAKAALEARFAWRDLGNTIANVGTTQKQMREGSVLMFGDQERINTARANMRAYAKQVGGTIAQVGLMAVTMSDLDNKVGLTNTALFALMGSMAGPWGAAAGAAVGFTLDFAKANDELTDSIKRAADAAADSEGGSGSLTELLESRQKLAEQMQKMKEDAAIMSSDPLGGMKRLFFSDDIRDAEKQLDELDAAIAKARGQLQLIPEVLASGRGQHGRAFFGDLTGAAHRAEVQMEDLADSIISVQNLLDRSGSLIAYEGALDELTKSIKENGQAWEVGTDAGRKNLTARNNLVDKAIARAQILKDQGDELGAQKILTRAISDLQTFADQSPKAKAAMQPLIRELKNVDGINAKPEVNVDTGDSEPKIKGIIALLNNIDPFVESVIRVRTEHMDVRLNRATGGHVRGPGGPTDDLIPARLSDGEYVIRTKAVEKYGVAMFDRLNSLAYAQGGLVKRYATGGAVKADTPKRDVFTLDEFRDVLSSFDHAIDDAGFKLRSQLDELRNSIKAAGGEWTRAMRQSSTELLQINRQYRRHQSALADAEAAVEATRQLIEDTQAKRDDLAASVAGQFNNQITGQGGLAAALKTLTGDISGAQTMTDLLNKLKGAGLDASGGLYQTLLNSNDTKLAQQLLASGASGIDYFQNLFNQRDALNAARGAAAGDEAFGGVLNELPQTLREQLEEVRQQQVKLQELKDAFREEFRALRQDLKAEVPDKIGKRVGEEVNGAISDGHRMGRNR